MIVMANLPVSEIKCTDIQTVAMSSDFGEEQLIRMSKHILLTF